MYSSHVFMNPEFSIGNCYLKKKNLFSIKKILVMYNIVHIHAISSYKDHLSKDKVLNLSNFKGYQYWIWKN